MERSDIDLERLRRVRVKDKAAFEQLYMDYYQRLFRFLFRLVHRVDMVEEVINDVMFVVWCKADTFNEQSRVSTWILGIAYRKGLKALRRERRRPETSELDDSFAASGPGPDGGLAQRQLSGALRVALDRLSPEHRMVIELSFFLGYSYPEIAAIAQCPVNTVKTRMFHARKRLRGLLPDVGVELRDATEMDR